MPSQSGNAFLFASVFKVLFGHVRPSLFVNLGRRSEQAHLSMAAHYNSFSRYVETESLTAVLQRLIEESSLPLQAIESEFATDRPASLLAAFTSG